MVRFTRVQTAAPAPARAATQRSTGSQAQSFAAALNRATSATSARSPRPQVVSRPNTPFGTPGAPANGGNTPATSGQTAAPAANSDGNTTKLALSQQFPTLESVFGTTQVFVENPTATLPDGSQYAYNPTYFATPEAAAKAAELVGGTVVARDDIGGGPITQNQPNQMIRFANGSMVNAGMVVNFYSHGWSQDMINGYLQLVRTEHGG